MPDVKIFVDGQCVSREAKEALLDEVPGIVADAMDCWVWSWKWPFRRHLMLSPENVDVMIFWDDESTMSTFDVFSNTQIIIEVAAYDYRDRKANMNRRIDHIARRIKEVSDGLAESLGHAVEEVLANLKCYHRRELTYSVSLFLGEMGYHADGVDSQ